jgi:hypothetical protein
VANATVTVQGKSDVGATVSADLAKAKGSLDALGKGSKGAKNEADGLGSALGSLNGALGALGWGVSIAGAAALASELYNVGAASQRAESALNAMTGGEADTYLAEVGNASRGTVSDMTILNATNRALALGVIDSADEMGQLTNAARVLGSVMGISTNQALNDMVTGVGRLSPMILDNLGIIVDQASMEEDVNRALARNAGMTAKAAQQQVLLNKILEHANQLQEQGVSVSNDAATSSERLSASAENLKTNVGELVSGALAPATESAANLMSGLSDTNDALSAHESEVARTAGGYDQWRSEMERLNGVYLLTRGHLANVSEEHYNKLKEAIASEAEATEKAAEASRGKAEADRLAAKAAEDRALSEQRATDALVQAGRQLDILQSIDAVTGAQANLNSIFEFGASSLKGYNLDAGQTLELYKALGLETGNLNLQQIAQSQTLNELNNLWVGGMLSASQYANSIQQIQQGADAAAVSLAAQGSAISSLARQYMDEGMPAAQAMAQATKEVGSSAAGTKMTLDEAKQKIADLSATVEAAAKIKPADIRINSNAPARTEEMSALISTVTGVTEGDLTKTVTVNDPTVPTATGDMTAANAQIAQLKDKTVTVTVNYVQTGQVPTGGVPGAGATGGVVGAYAGGTLDFPGGIGMVGERGAEMVHLPAGTRIYSHEETLDLLSAAQGSKGSISETYYVTIVAQNGDVLKDLIRQAKAATR